MSQKVRKHGCSWPFHKLQVVGGCVAAFMAAVTFGVVLPLLPGGLKVLFGVCCGIAECLVGALAVILTYSDPTDPTVYAHQAAKAAQ